MSAEGPSFVKAREEDVERLTLLLSTTGAMGLDGEAGFVEWAVRKLDTALADCEDDGDGYCMVHAGWDRDYDEDSGELMHCDMAGLD